MTDCASNLATRSQTGTGRRTERRRLGKVSGHSYAFIGLERIGGVMAYDVSNLAPFRNELIELHNAMNGTINLDGPSLQYAPFISSGTCEVALLPAVPVEPGKFVLA